MTLLLCFYMFYLYLVIVISGVVKMFKIYISKSKNNKIFGPAILIKILLLLILLPLLLLLLLLIIIMGLEYLLTDTLILHGLS